MEAWRSCSEDGISQGMNVLRDHWRSTVAVIWFVTVLLIRFTFFPYSNGDMQGFNLIWYRTLATEGVLDTLGTNFANYTPPYTYLVALATLTKGFFAPLTALKLIPTCFDILNAWIVFHITRIRYPHGSIPLLAATVFFSAPTVMLNSSYWGQADSLYATFLLLCLYFALRQRPMATIICFGLAFTVKAQAAFLFPFLLIMIPHTRRFWISLLIIPAVYLAAVLPTVLLGRPLKDVLFIYVEQARTFRELSMNAPNLYAFIPNGWYDLAYPICMILALIIIALWVRSRKGSCLTIDHETIVLYAATSALMVPFLLPKMHDRYFYPAEVLAIVLIFFRPSLWYIPILLQAASIMAYSRFLFKSDLLWLWVAAIQNTVTLGLLFWGQQQEKRIPRAGAAQQI